MKPIKSIDEIDALVQKANLAASDSGQYELLDALSDLRIVGGSACGENGFGHFIGIRNTNRSRIVHAYYQITSNINGPWENNQQIGPGQTAWITCSYPASNQYMSVHITGAYYP